MPDAATIIANSQAWDPAADIAAGRKLANDAYDRMVVQSGQRSYGQALAAQAAANGTAAAPGGASYVKTIMSLANAPGQLANMVQIGNYASRVAALAQPAGSHAGGRGHGRRNTGRRSWRHGGE